MARSSKNSKTKKSKPARRAAPEPEVLEQVDEGGWGIDEGMVFVTFAALAGAFYMLWTMIGERYPDPL